ncbi:fumarate hydratase [Thermodesulfobacterium sp. TA1]|uniref:fumarate hydratase n=1 Tax=Thermodesulfobacterium sp. TA1 TaxID=2234087 RepID=UPI0012326566|nr:fumarate hydratase [Thermodesulfobacterium sp. TA1]QER42883.1 fumarate hydratase [Thermodesulfobacterium sp. TA1]
MDREVAYQEIVEKVKEAYIKACKILPEEVLVALKKALEEETEPLAKAVLEVLIENAEIALKENLPICQDTGIPVVWVRMGEEVKIENLEKAVNEGLFLAYKEGLLRASVCEVLTRKNTGTNTPAVIHYEIVPERVLEIEVLPKGCGSENMSALVMLPPSAGVEGIKRFVVETVKKAGPNPCPPITVGVGIGGTFEKAALLAKRALFRPLGKLHPNPEIACLERELLTQINTLMIGPLGLKGKTTALGVHIETYPSHIASLPVAVNLQCHAYRIAKIKLL